jgi:predicted RNA binding protein YcfA (HicA-like mRNA interferase family)
MSPKLPRITGRQPVAALGRMGFETVRVRGSHHFLRHPDGRATVVAVHSGETVDPGLLGKILRASQVTREHLAEFL